nr:alanine and arginine-rich domain-containing protein [Podarcis muralis]
MTSGVGGEDVLFFSPEEKEPRWPGARKQKAWPGRRRRRKRKRRAFVVGVRLAAEICAPSLQFPASLPDDRALLMEPTKTSAEQAACEEAFCSSLLDDIKQRLLHAFRGQGGAAAPQQLLMPSRPAAPCKGRGVEVAWEEARRAHVEGAIAWLRVELLEMKSQNHKLAKTLLDLSMEIQRLRSEADVPTALESKALSFAASSE